MKPTCVRHGIHTPKSTKIIPNKEGCITSTGTRQRTLLTDTHKHIGILPEKKTRHDQIDMVHTTYTDNRVLCLVGINLRHRHLHRPDPTCLV